MTTFVQAERRPIWVETGLGQDKLMLDGFRGTEAISMPFRFELDLLSEDPRVDATGLLRKPISLKIRLTDGGTREMHGMVSRFSRLGRRGELAVYRAEMVPWLWFLSITRNCRIFQAKSVLEIVEKVFTDLGFNDFRSACTRTYPKREYCVQYRESDLDFVSRLLEEEGIFYFFDHSGGKHTLVLADGNGAFAECPGQSTARYSSEVLPEEDVVTSFGLEYAVYPGAVRLQDYDYLQPSLSLSGNSQGDGTGEIYDYHPGRYATVDDGDRYARIRLEAEEATRLVLRGGGNCRFLQSGHTFELEDADPADVNRGYVLLQVGHSGSVGRFQSGEDPSFDYRSELLAIPDDVPYRPPLRTPKPMVRGSQTAVVVGKSGEEIWTDSHGRVKVQFHWDRDGERDDGSSCWIRVATLWAGKSWGMVHIPRIGQEVVVDFLEGDPDRPIITGSVYNADQVPPYELPEHQTKSGIKSRSSKEGTPETFNEIRFEDKKGEEQVYIHAEKDLVQVVENDRRVTVGNDEHIQIKGMRLVAIGEVEADDVVATPWGDYDLGGGDEFTVYEASRLALMHGDSMTHVDGRYLLYVKDHSEIQCDDDLETTIGGKEVHKVAKDREVKVDGKSKTDVGSNMNVKAGQSLEIEAGQKITIKANQAIELKVGSNSIKIDQSGITLKGMKVKLDASVQAEVKGLMTNVNGNAMVKVKGGVTMIN